MYTYTLLATACVSSLALGQKLTKPALESDLDYLKQGLMDHLPIAPSTKQEWNGYIPADCQSIAQEAKLDPKDVTAYSVTYNDVNPAWMAHTCPPSSYLQKLIAKHHCSAMPHGSYAATKTAPPQWVT